MKTGVKTVADYIKLFSGVIYTPCGVIKTLGNVVIVAFIIKDLLRLN
jgi:hypothetical protein